MVNFQIQITKRRDALPITRDYMTETERRLTARENGTAIPDAAE
jgi:cyclopropane-fatty-acyl-phospholipid synthase